MPPNAALVQVTQQVVMNKTVTTQTAGNAPAEEFNAQLPLTKSSIVHTIPVAGGFTDSNDEYQGLFGSPYFFEQYSWQNTMGYQDLPRRLNNEWSPKSLPAPSKTYTQFEYNNINFSQGLVVQILLDTVPLNFMVNAWGGSSYLPILQASSSSNDLVITYMISSVVNFKLTANMLSDTHLLTLQITNGTASLAYDESSILFSLGFITPGISGFASGDAAGLMQISMITQNTVIFAIDSNLVIHYPNPVVLDTTSVAPPAPGFFLNRLLSPAVPILTNSYIMPSVFSVPYDAAYGRVRVAVSATQVNFVPALGSYDQGNHPLNFIYNAAAYNINLANFTATFALGLPNYFSGTTEYFGATVFLQLANGTAVGLIEVDGANVGAYGSVTFSTLNSDDTLVNDVTMTYENSQKSDETVYLILESENGVMYEGFEYRGVYLLWELDTLSGTPISTYLAQTTSLYVNLGGTYTSWLFAGMSCTTALPVPEVYTGGGAWAENPRGTSQAATPDDIIAKYGQLNSLADELQVIAIPIAGDQAFSKPTGYYVFSAENIDLRRIQATLSYFAYVPENISVYNDVTLNMQVTFFGGITLQKIWFGSGSGTLSYDSGQIAVGQVQNGQTSQGVQIELIVQQVATVDLTNLAAYDVAVTSGEAHVTIQYNIYAVFVSSAYSASWILNVALTLLAPLAVVILFPIVMHKVWQRQEAYGIGLMLSGVILLFSNLVTAMVAVIVEGLGLFITFVIVRSQHQGGEDV